MKHSISQIRFNPAAFLRFTICLFLALPATAMVSETEKEFVATGDFNGDGKLDVAIVDRDKGRVRIGYQLSPDSYDWAIWKAGGVKNVTGVAVGRLLDEKHDSLCLVSPEDNLITIVDAPSANLEKEPIKVTTTAVGPNTVAAIDIGGPGNTPLRDLYVASIYNNEPTFYLSTLFRSDGKAAKELAGFPIAGTEIRAAAVSLKTGGPEFVAVLSSGEKGDVLRVVDLSSGKPVEVLTLGDAPGGGAFVVGNFRGTPVKEFVFYTAGDPTLTVRPLTEAGGKYQAGDAKSFTLDRPLRQLIAVEGGKKTRLLAVFGDEEPAELMDFDVVNPPVAVQKLAGAPHHFLNTAAALPDTIFLFSAMTNRISGLPAVQSAAYHQIYLLRDGKYVAGPYGGLETLDDRDDATVPEIHQRIVAQQVEKSAADMKRYTNTLPGTDVKYEMLPIPGGEFAMGSPDSEKDRKPDESPQHRVKISPFWMGMFEVTWDMYLLFIYPEDEVKLREKFPTSEEINNLSDAVTRPSKPYVDMSFGMGKTSRSGGRGFPAIAMTQHGANKFCHWLSAKTGHFYRLPTEAEWEYACRAGSTTAYSFGDDPAELPNYAWFFDNSNSKYQEVGKKKPNPWGLYDMHGNVTEWVLDQYDPEYYRKADPKTVIADPWNKATKPYPHSVRGGSWDDDPPALRSAARRGSDRSWKMTDPQLPKGKWYFTDAQFVGFRLVRPLAIPSAEDMKKYWISGVEKE